MVTGCDESMTHEPITGARRASRVRRAVAAVVVSEAIVVIGYGFVLAIDTLVSNPTTRSGAAFMALIVVLLGAGVAGVGVAVWRAQRWSRAPALVWQVLQLAVAVPALGSPRPWIGAPLVVMAVAVIAGIFVPGVLDDPDEDGGPRAAGGAAGTPTRGPDAGPGGRST
jgi:peptidoglycan/LPS O-acetylase OafA/YrhL